MATYFRTGHTFGKHGGYSSFVGEVISQSSTQFYSTGDIQFRNFDKLALTSSWFVRDGDKITSTLQGVQGTFFNEDFNGKKGGLLFEKQSTTYLGLSIPNGIYGAHGGIPGFTDYTSGSMQGILDAMEKRKGL